jgi:hypothetical protein
MQTNGSAGTMRLEQHRLPGAWHLSRTCCRMLNVGHVAVTARHAVALLRNCRLQDSRRTPLEQNITICMQFCWCRSLTTCDAECLPLLRLLWNCCLTGLSVCTTNRLAQATAICMPLCSAPALARSMRHGVRHVVLTTPSRFWRLVGTVAWQASHRRTRQRFRKILQLARKFAATARACRWRHRIRQVALTTPSRFWRLFGTVAW